MKKIFLLSFLLILIFGCFFISQKKEPSLLYQIAPSKIKFKIDVSVSPYDWIFPQIERSFINNSKDTIVLYNYFTLAFQEQQALIDSVIFNGVTWMLYDSLCNSPDEAFLPLELSISQIPNKNQLTIDSLYTPLDDMEIYGYDSETFKLEEYIRRITFNNRRIVLPHDTLTYRGDLDLLLFYKSLRPGKYKVISYYYIDENIKKEIGEEVYEKEKDKIPMGLYKANEIELIVE